jgi:ubiquinone/menaquinone biosynthesis C-methylase UbiE
MQDSSIVKEKQRPLSAEQAREKNVEEYNMSANAYDQWSHDNMIMQEYCYYSTINELSK